MLPYQSTSRKEDGIVIVGLGGAGASILQRFSGSSAENVRLCIMSLDERLGRECGNVEFVQLGAGLNHGLGSGGDPEVARMAIEESADQVEALLRDSRLLVMVVGLGGGTGSGVAPVLARKAKDAGIFLVSVVVMPFGFEGARRRRQADIALEEIASISDIVFCFENDYMEDLFRSRTGAQAVFEEANALLSQATASVPLLANSPGIINIGLDELVTALDNNDSRCVYGAGKGYGPKRAEDAARAALASPLVAYHGALKHARTVIVHVAGGSNMSLTELRVAMETVRGGLGGDDVNIFFGAAVKPLLGEEMRVSIIASVDYREMQAAIMAEEEADDEPEEEAAPAEPVAEETLAEEEASEDEAFEDEVEPYSADEDDEEEPPAEPEDETGEPLLEPDDEYVPSVAAPVREMGFVTEREPLPSREPVPVTPAPAAPSSYPASKPALQSEFNLEMSFGDEEDEDSEPWTLDTRAFGGESTEARGASRASRSIVKSARGGSMIPQSEEPENGAELYAGLHRLLDMSDEEEPAPAASGSAAQPRSPLGFNDVRDMLPPTLP